MCLRGRQAVASPTAGVQRGGRPQQRKPLSQALAHNEGQVPSQLRRNHFFAASAGLHLAHADTTRVIVIRLAGRDARSCLGLCLLAATRLREVRHDPLRDKKVRTALGRHNTRLACAAKAYMYILWAPPPLTGDFTVLVLLVFGSFPSIFLAFFCCCCTAHLEEHKYEQDEAAGSKATSPIAATHTYKYWCLRFGGVSVSIRVAARDLQVISS